MDFPELLRREKKGRNLTKENLLKCDKNNPYFPGSK